MYKDIYDCAKKNNLIPQKNRTMRKISGYIQLDSDGNFIRVEGVNEEILCPDKGNLHGNSACNPICEKAGKMFPSLNSTGLNKKNDNDKYRDSYDKEYGWKWIMNYGAEHDTNCAIINRFIKKADNDEELCNQIIKEFKENKIKLESYISYKIEGMEVERTSTWGKWFDNYVMQERKKGKQVKEIISSITGKKVESVSEKSGPAVKTEQTNNQSAYIVSCDKDSFCSYGFKNNENCSMGQEDAELIKEMAERFLSSENNHNRPFGIVYWYDKRVQMDIIGRSCRKRENIVNEKEEKYSQLLKAAESMLSPLPDYDDTRYMIIQFDVPGQGRIRFHGGHQGSYTDLYNYYDKWLSDTAISFSFYSREEKRRLSAEKRIDNLYEILFGLLEHKDAKKVFEQIDKEYGSCKAELLWSVYENKQIPRLFYRKALYAYEKSIFNKTSVSSGENSKETENAKQSGQPYLLALSIIKTFLIREKGDVYNMTKVNLENTSSAYLLGRVLAVVQAAQKASTDRDVGMDVTSKYYKLATTSPDRALYMITSNWFPYLKKLRREGKIGLAKRYEKDMAQILKVIHEKEIPKRFTEAEKGELIMGYYFQKEENYKTTKEIEEIKGEEI